MNSRKRGGKCETVLNVSSSLTEVHTVVAIKGFEAAAKKGRKV